MKVRAKGSAAAARQRAAAAQTARRRRWQMVIGAGVAAVAAVVGLILIGGALRGDEDVAERLAPADGFTLGSPDAPVEVTAWEDFQCPVCKAANNSVLRQLEEDYVNTGKVKLVFRQFPFLGEESFWAAEASQCAAEQDAFWAYHDAAFAAQKAENSGALSIKNLKAIAADLGLDTEAFNSCLDNGTHTASVQAEKSLGESLGVRGTPAIFVDGVRVADWRDYSTLKAMIDTALRENEG